MASNRLDLVIGEASGRLPISCDVCHEVHVTVQLDIYGDGVPFWICRACALAIVSRFDAPREEEQNDR